MTARGKDIFLGVRLITDNERIEGLTTSSLPFLLPDQEVMTEYGRLLNWANSNGVLSHTLTKKVGLLAKLLKCEPTTLKKNPLLVRWALEIELQKEVIAFLLYYSREGLSLEISRDKNHAEYVLHRLCQILLPEQENPKVTKLRNRVQKMLSRLSVKDFIACPKGIAATLHRLPTVEEVLKSHGLERSYKAIERATGDIWRQEIDNTRKIFFRLRPRGLQKVEKFVDEPCEL